MRAGSWLWGDSTPFHPLSPHPSPHRPRVVGSSSVESRCPVGPAPLPLFEARTTTRRDRVKKLGAKKWSVMAAVRAVGHQIYSRGRDWGWKWDSIHGRIGVINDMGKKDGRYTTCVAWTFDRVCTSKSTLSFSLSPKKLASCHPRHTSPPNL